MRSLSLLALTAYVLLRQRRTLRDLGVTARRTDPLFGFVLAGLNLLPFAIGGLARDGAFPGWLTGPLTVSGLDLVEFVNLLCFAAVSSVLFVAYVVTEVRALTSSTALAVAASLGFEQLHHRGFGLATTASLLVNCLFYCRTRRAMPLLLALVLSWLWILLHPTPS